MNKKLIAALMSAVFVAGASFATLSHAGDKPDTEKKDTPSEKEKKDKDAPADKEKK